MSVAVLQQMSSVPWQRQYHSQIDNLIEETVKEMTTLLVAKVTQVSPVQSDYSQQSAFRSVFPLLGQRLQT